MPRARSSRARRPFLVIVVAAVILAFSGIGFAAATAATNNINRVPVFGLLDERADSDSGTNILMIGSDDRTGLSAEERSRLHVGQGDYGSNTDSMMIVHLADDGSVDVVSIPRDSLADIPEHTGPKGITSPASTQKINAAYSIGGPSLAVATVEKNTGVQIDHYMEINFAGFVSVVDSLGGVQLTLETPIDDEKAGINLSAGPQTLDGAEALGFVRARYFDPTSDLGRMQRQQQFIGATFKQALSPATLLNPVKLMTFLNATARAITVDDEFSNSEIWSLITRMRSVDPSQIVFQTVPVATDEEISGVGWVVTWDKAKSEAMFERLRTGSSVAGTPSTN